MATPEEVVTAFIREWDVEHPDVDTLASYFTDDAVYHNIYHNMPACGADGPHQAEGIDRPRCARRWPAWRG